MTEQNATVEVVRLGDIQLRKRQITGRPRGGGFYQPFFDAAADFPMAENREEQGAVFVPVPETQRAKERSSAEHKACVQSALFSWHKHRAENGTRLGVRETEDGKVLVFRRS